MINPKNFKFSKPDLKDKNISKETLVQLVNLVSYYMDMREQYKYCTSCRMIYTHNSEPLFQNPFDDLPYKLQKYYQISNFKCKQCEVEYDIY